jgi:murein L,D-transpeptidase YcbB/YkuD
MQPFQISFLLLAAIMIFSCRNEKTNKGKVKKNVDVSISQGVKPADKNRFNQDLAFGFFTQFPQLKTIEADWREFYAERNFSFAWVDTSGLTSAAVNLHNRVNNISDDGLNDSLLYRQEFNEIFEAASSLEGNNFKDSTMIRAEMMLTAQYFIYARQIYKALGPEELKKMGWLITPQKISYTEFLNKALSENKDAFENEPVYYQYGLLRNFLKKYKDIESKGGFPVIDSSIKNIALNDSSKALTNIKKYLILTGDLTTKDSSIKMNTATAKAVRSFRTRHGLKDTALVDKAMVVQMNVPIQKRIEQILVNMERSRWMPNNPSENHISVNIPDYTMNVYENNKLQFSMNVVVGASATKTVIFNDTLKTIAFSPYWNVPYSIYKKEMSGLSAASLKRRNMERTGPTSIRQLPGGNNALGKVKFLFPNQHNIYFHDTPQKDKFRYSQRAFSHGCIRLSQPKKLAEYLLRNETKYTSKVIDSLMNQRKETQVKLKKQIPVFIGYFTAFVHPTTKQLQFRKDIYGYDKKVLESIVKK